MFDAHNHLDDRRLDGERETLLSRARAVGVRGFVVAGVDQPGWERQAELARTEPDVFVCYGLHPWAAASLDDGAVDAQLEALEVLSAAPPTGAEPVGWGELGLDYSKRLDRATRPRQQRAFEAQLRAAIRLDLPLVLHVVRAHEDVLRALSEVGVPEAGGMVHSFSGSREVSERYLRLGLHLSLSGSVIDHPNARVAAMVPGLPLDRLLLETDAPDQTPRPLRPARNAPENLVVVAGAVAAMRGESLSSVAEATEKNARALFRLAPDNSTFRPVGRTQR